MAVEVRVRRVHVEEVVSGRAHFLDVHAAAVRENDVAGIAVAGLERALAVRCFLVAVVTAESAGPVLVAEMLGIRAPTSRSC